MQISEFIPTLLHEPLDDSTLFSLSFFQTTMKPLYERVPNLLTPCSDVEIKVNFISLIIQFQPSSRASSNAKYYEMPGYSRAGKVGFSLIGQGCSSIISFSRSKQHFPCSLSRPNRFGAGREIVLLVMEHESGNV